MAQDSLLAETLRHNNQAAEAAAFFEVPASIPTNTDFPPLSDPYFIMTFPGKVQYHSCSRANGFNHDKSTMYTGVVW